MINKVKIIKFGKKVQLELERRFFWYYFVNRLKHTTPLIIYQMGKVGSQSIYYSLRRNYPGVVVSSHTFSSNDLDWRIRRIYQYCVIDAHPLKIISMTREPISRNISAFFQNFERETGVPFQRSDFSMGELKQLFIQNFDHEKPLSWFNQHIKFNFDIDVYSQIFPANGYCQYTNRNYQLLIIRSEINDEIKKSAIKDFLDIPDFTMDQRNIGSAKDYAETYKQFRNSVKLPIDYISRMCDSEYFNHFYDEEFINAVRQNWMQR